jgi:hypothetical protein
MGLGVSYSQDALAGMCILVVEDVYYLADHFEAIIGSAGGQVAGPYDTVADALAFLAQESVVVSAASLDIKLLDGEVYPVAERLAALNIPFVFATGAGGSNFPDRFAGAPIVSKPLSPERLVEALLLLKR